MFLLVGSTFDEPWVELLYLFTGPKQILFIKTSRIFLKLFTTSRKGSGLGGEVNYSVKISRLFFIELKYKYWIEINRNRNRDLYFLCFPHFKEYLKKEKKLKNRPLIHQRDNTLIGNYPPDYVDDWSNISSQNVVYWQKKKKAHIVEIPIHSSFRFG